MSRWGTRNHTAWNGTWNYTQNVSGYISRTAQECAPCGFYRTPKLGGAYTVTPIPRHFKMAPVVVGNPAPDARTAAEVVWTIVVRSSSSHLCRWPKAESWPVVVTWRCLPCYRPCRKCARDIGEDFSTLRRRLHPPLSLFFSTFLFLIPDCDVCAARWSADDVSRPQNPRVITLRKWGFKSSWLCCFDLTVLKEMGTDLCTVWDRENLRGFGGP